MTYAVRIVVSHVLYFSGVLPAVLWLRLRRKTVVLAYHRVLKRSQWSLTASQDGLLVEEETFARHAAVLRRFFNPLTLEEFADRLRRRVPFAGPSCLITFDDGWIDNFENAMPILKKHDLPAVMFLPVNFIGQRRLFTREALTHLLARAVTIARRSPGVPEGLRPRLRSLGLESVLDIKALDPLPEVVRLIRAHRYASGPAFEALVAALATELSLEGAHLSDLDTFIDWEQVDRLGRGGFTFGGHGAEHYVLTEIPAEEARFEVETSKRVLDQRLPGAAQAFAYPNGGWSPAIARTVAAAGYEMAFTIDAGHVSCTDNPFTLARINIHEGMTRSTPMFMARLAGIF